MVGTRLIKMTFEMGNPVGLPTSGIEIPMSYAFQVNHYLMPNGCQSTGFPICPVLEHIKTV